MPGDRHGWHRMYVLDASAGGRSFDHFADDYVKFQLAVIAEAQLGAAKDAIKAVQAQIRNTTPYAPIDLGRMLNGYAVLRQVGGREPATIIINRAAHAAKMEFGGPPEYVPLTQLLPWARRKLLTNRTSRGVAQSPLRLPGGEAPAPVGKFHAVEEKGKPRAAGAAKALRDRSKAAVSSGKEKQAIQLARGAQMAIMTRGHHPDYAPDGRGFHHIAQARFWGIVKRWYRKTHRKEKM